ncbi:hypothetical protein SLE2022_353070 [Rubroshorea leprosula]
MEYNAKLRIIKSEATVGRLRDKADVAIPVPTDVVCMPHSKESRQSSDLARIRETAFCFLPIRTSLRRPVFLGANGAPYPEFWIAPVSVGDVLDIWVNEGEGSMGWDKYMLVFYLMQKCSQAFLGGNFLASGSARQPNYCAQRIE